jgi:hypothetical protein
MAAKSKTKSAESEPELVSNAWARFERAVDVVAKSPPQPKKKKSAAKSKQRKKKQ